MSNNSKRIRPPRRWFILIGIIIAVSLLFLVGYNLATYSAPMGGSDVSSTPNKDTSTPHGNPNEHYGELVRKKNEQSYEDADESGDSFVPTVGAYPNEGLGLKMPEPEPEPEEPEDKIPQPDLGKPEPEPEPEPPSDPAPPPQEIGIRQSSSNNLDSTSAITEEMRQIMRQQNLPEQTVAVYWEENEEQAQPASQESIARRPLSQPAESGTTAVQPSNGSTRAARPSLPASSLTPGDIFYASTNTALDSDQPGPAMATVVAGDLKGAKFLGSFQRRDDRLVVEFNRFVPPDGQPRSITAYAVDTDTSKASVATAVDHHYLSRWGGLIAASFAEGFGRAVQRSGSTVTTSIGTGGSSSIIVNPDRTAEKQALEALGEVGQTAGEVMEENFDRPPTVEIAANTPIGILVTEGQ